MVGRIDPREQFGMSPMEFIRKYADQLCGEYENVKLVDNREEELTVDVYYGNDGFEEHKCLFVVGGSIFPFDFAPDDEEPIIPEGLGSD